MRRLDIGGASFYLPANLSVTLYVYLDVLDPIVMIDYLITLSKSRDGFGMLFLR